MSQYVPETGASPEIDEARPTDRVLRRTRRSRASSGASAPSTRRSPCAAATATPCRSRDRAASRRCCAGWPSATAGSRSRRTGTSSRCSGRKASITLEPGGQLELSGELCESVHCAAGRVRRAHRPDRHRRRRARHRLPRPRHAADQPADEIERVPKRRYGIMWPHMARVGTLGQRMMKQTATVQVNIDYGSEADAMQKMRVGMGIGSAAHGDVRQLAAQRRRPQRLQVVPRPHLDRHRHGALRPAAVRLPIPAPASSDYVDYALDVPMYFIVRDGAVDRHDRAHLPRLLDATATRATAPRWPTGTRT